MWRDQNIRLKPVANSGHQIPTCRKCPPWSVKSCKSWFKIIYRKHPPKSSTSPFFGGNYVRSSLWFVSGFSGFRGFTITSSLWLGRLLLNSAFITLLFADALHISEKKGIKTESTNNPFNQIGNVLCNQWNPVIHKILDSKLFTGNITHLHSQIKFRFVFTKPYLCHESIFI